MHHASFTWNQSLSLVLVKKKSTLGLIIYWPCIITWLFVWWFIRSKASLFKFSFKVHSSFKDHDSRGIQTNFGGKRFYLKIRHVSLNQRTIFIKECPFHLHKTNITRMHTKLQKKMTLTYSWFWSTIDFLSTNWSKSTNLILIFTLVFTFPSSHLTSHPSLLHLQASHAFFLQVIILDFHGSLTLKSCKACFHKQSITHQTFHSKTRMHEPICTNSIQYHSQQESCHGSILH